jgi:hypothetical protein
MMRTKNYERFRVVMENIRNCPFCGSERIVVIIDKTPKDHIFPNSEYAYALCKGCWARGPWAYKVDKTDEEIVQYVIGMWNEENAYYKEVK